MWKKLSATLRELTDHYGTLYKLNLKKRSALVEMNMKLLEEIVNKEQEITGQISEVEARRQSLMLDLSAVCGGVRPGMKRFELYRYVPEDLRDEIVGRDTDLSKAVQQVRKLSESNTLLISGFLKAVNIRLNRLGGSTVEPAYGQKGEEIVTKQKRFDFEV